MSTTSTLRQPRVIAFPSPPAANPAGLYLARLAPGSRPTVRWALRAAARSLGQGEDPLALDWSRVGYPELVQLRARLASRYAPASANLVLSAVRSVLREAWRLGEISAEALARACDVPRVRGSAAQAGRQLERGELAALLAACRRDPGPQGARDAAIVAVLATTGLRRAELAALELADYDAGSGALTVREGKGGKGRRVWATAAGEYVACWLAVRGARPGPLVLPVRRDGCLRWRPLTGDGILKLLRRRAREAGLVSFSPHDLRRTWIGSMLDAGADLVAVQTLAGHADPATTARYDRRPERSRREAAARLRLPAEEELWHT